jgi:23S rRNA (adenine2503-C2)-methyltransferase
VSDQSAPSLLALSAEELLALVTDAGGKAFHAKIIRRDVIERGVFDYAQMTSLPADLRARLSETLPILTGREVDRVKARDGTIKLLIGFPDDGGGTSMVETVYIPPIRDKSGKGATLCVSTQVGCPVACPFCASGLGGLVRNLKSHEIIEQYLRGRAVGPLSRSVVMGIGEPLLNTRALVTALNVITNEFGIGARKLTVSTVGFPDRLHKLAREKPPFQLAISLHTPFDEQRYELVPAMRGVPVEDILAAGDDWFEVTGREVTYEYALLGNCNDSADHAHELARRLTGRRATVNLIPYNPNPTLPYDRPHPETVTNFQATLQEAGIIATVRWSRGLDGSAACGQLRAQAEN